MPYSLTSLWLSAGWSPREQSRAEQALCRLRAPAWVRQRTRTDVLFPSQSLFAPSIRWKSYILLYCTVHSAFIYCTAPSMSVSFACAYSSSCLSSAKDSSAKSDAQYALCYLLSIAYSLQYFDQRIVPRRSAWSTPRLAISFGSRLRHRS